MSNKNRTIPEDLKLAAKRGFVRTTFQAYATALAGGISSSAILAVLQGEVLLMPQLVVIVTAALSPLAAGAASYLSIIAKGIPQEYQVPENLQEDETL